MSEPTVHHPTIDAAGRINWLEYDHAAIALHIADAVLAFLDYDGDCGKDRFRFEHNMPDGIELTINVERTRGGEA